MKKHLEFLLHSEISFKTNPHIKNTVYINCKQKTFNELKEIYELYPTISSQSEEFKKKVSAFYNTLQSENKWKKSKIKFNDETYEGKIKIHGKTPWQHKDCYHFSLRIKTDSTIENINAQKFSLIVYSRIKEKYDVLKYFSDKIELFLKSSELINVSINGKQNNLYFLETKNSNIFPNNDSCDFITMKSSKENPLINTWGIEKKTFEQRLKNKVNKVQKNDSVKTIIYTYYKKLNNAIFNNDSDLVNSFFDKIYISKLLAFTSFANLNGHGFDVINLEMAFNIKTRKFYPILHRDNIPRPIKPTGSTFIKYNFEESFPNPLFRIIYNNKTFTKDAEVYLEKVLLKNIKENEINEIIKKHQSYYFDTYFMSFLEPDSTNIYTSNLNFLGKSLIVN